LRLAGALAKPWSLSEQSLGDFVFFTQHCFEKRSIGLWERRFFIAPQEVIGNFSTATEGGIPMSRLPGDGSYKETRPWVCSE